MKKMNFTIHNKNIGQTQPATIPYKNQLKTMTTTPSNTTITTQTSTPIKKMKWGEPTWFLFHTLACKVKEEYFQQIKKELLNNIYSICANLPCPTCAQHAMDYMKSINFNTIKTKEDLKNMLFVFHNSINAKKGFTIFQYSDLDDKYSKAVTINIIHNFFHYYSDKHKSIHMIANDLYRSRQIVLLKEWFHKNIQYFDP